MSVQKNVLNLRKNKALYRVKESVRNVGGRGVGGPWG